MSMNIFKLYLGKILGQYEPREGGADSGPLQLYRQHPRQEVGLVLTSDRKLGPPGPFIPRFYKECSFIQVNPDIEVCVCVCVRCVVGLRCVCGGPEMCVWWA